MDNISSSKLLSEWINKRETTECVTVKGRKNSFDLPVTDKSILGVILAEYSLITVLDEKIRLLGGDDSQRASVCTLNKIVGGKETAFPGLLVIGDDICGGIFAINNGFVPNVNKGNVVFLPADSLEFEDLGVGHANFVYWSMTLSEEEWLDSGFKTSDKHMIHLREADEYIKAKLVVISDLMHT